MAHTQAGSAAEGTRGVASPYIAQLVQELKCRQPGLTCSIACGNPSDAQPRPARGLAAAAERDASLIGVCSCRQAVCRIQLQPAVHLITADRVAQEVHTE